MNSPDHLADIRQVATNAGIFSLHEGNALYLALEPKTDIKPITEHIQQAKGYKAVYTWQTAEGGGDVMKIQIA